MASPINYEFGKAIKLIRESGEGKEARLPVLINLWSSSNGRNRSVASIESIAQDTGLSKTVIVAALAWLEDQGALYNVPASKRSGNEKRVRSNQNVYQLTGLMKLGEKVIEYLHMTPEGKSDALAGMVACDREDIQKLFLVEDDETAEEPDPAPEEGQKPAPEEEPNLPESGTEGQDQIIPESGTIENHLNIPDSEPMEKLSGMFNNPIVPDSEHLPLYDSDNLFSDNLSQIKTDTQIDPDFSKVVRAFEVIRTGTNTAMDSEMMKDDLATHGVEKVLAAIAKAEPYKPGSFQYVSRILLNEGLNPTPPVPPSPPAQQEQDEIVVDYAELRRKGVIGAYTGGR